MSEALIFKQAKRPGRQFSLHISTVSHSSDTARGQVVFSEAQIQIHFPPETDFLNRKHLSRIRLMKSVLHSCGNSISNLQQKCIAFGFMRNLGASMLWFIKKHRVQKLDNLSLSVYETQVKKYLFQHSLAWIQLKWYYNKKNRETLKMLPNVIVNQNLT